jgi:predicted metal-dependent hydrolase
MTALKVRRVRFDFEKPVPFLWNPENPAFSISGNVLSIIAIGFERFIVAVIKEAIPLIDDPAVVAEADAFLRQEAQHSSAHQQHVRALIRRYPGLKATLDKVIAMYEELAETASLPFKLAYIADIEATFTPAFKLVLDNEKTLFSPGDDRIASLFLWHFVEEIEHRSSALIIYDAVVDSKNYRLRALPGVIKHVAKVNAVVGRGFEEHVPAEDRDLGPKLPAVKRLRNAASRVLPFVAADPSPVAPAFLGTVPFRQKAVALKGILASQIPGHSPEHEALPEFADKWFARYESGEDVVHWYWSERSGQRQSEGS